MEFYNKCLKFKKEVKPICKKMTLGSYLIGVGFLSSCGAMLTEAKPLEEILIVGGVSALVLGTSMAYTNGEKLFQINKKYFGV